MWETLRVGQYIVPYKDKYYVDTQIVHDMFSVREVPLPKPDYNAVPNKILAIDLPYMLIESIDTGTKTTIDLRRWDVKICDKKYVRAFINDIRANMSGSNRPKNLCPICGDTMVSFRSEKVQEGYKAWSLRCKKCKIECKEYE